MASSEWSSAVDFLFENIEFHCWSSQQTCLFCTTGSFYDAMTQWHIHYKLDIHYKLICSCAFVVVWHFVYQHLNSNTIFSNIYPENIYRDEMSPKLQIYWNPCCTRQLQAGPLSQVTDEQFYTLSLQEHRVVGRGRTVGRFVGTCVPSRKLLLLAAGCTGRGSGQSADYWTVHPSVWWVGPITLQPFPPQLSFAFKMFDQFVLNIWIWIILPLLYQLSL